MNRVLKEKQVQDYIEIGPDCPYKFRICPMFSVKVLMMAFEGTEEIYKDISRDPFLFNGLHIHVLYRIHVWG